MEMLIKELNELKAKFNLTQWDLERIKEIEDEIMYKSEILDEWKVAIYSDF